MLPPSSLNAAPVNPEGGGLSLTSVVSDLAGDKLYIRTEKHLYAFAHMK